MLQTYSFFLHESVTKRSSQVIMPLESLHKLTYMLRTFTHTEAGDKKTIIIILCIKGHSEWERYSQIYINRGSSFLFSTLWIDISIQCNGWLVGCCTVTVKLINMWSALWWTAPMWPYWLQRGHKASADGMKTFTFTQLHSKWIYLLPICIIIHLQTANLICITPLLIQYLWIVFTQSLHLSW